MKHPTFVHLAAIVLACSCVSCGDDPELVEKSEQQKAEIMRLNGELALMKEKFKSLPPDFSAELEEARKQKNGQMAEVARLEAELSELTERKQSLQAEFESYRKKYQVK